MPAEIEAEYGGEAEYLDALIALAAHHQDAASGATWLIKLALDRCLNPLLHHDHPFMACFSGCSFQATNNDCCFNFNNFF